MKKGMLFVFAFLGLMSFGSASINVSGCDTLDNQGGVYELTQDIFAAGNCFGISESNITLDCQGYSIIGSGSGYGVYGQGSCVIGALFNHNHLSNITLKNCVISGFSKDVHVDGRVSHSPNCDNSGEAGANLIIINSIIDSVSSNGYDGSIGGGWGGYGGNISLFNSEVNSIISAGGDPDCGTEYYTYDYAGNGGNIFSYNSSVGSYSLPPGTDSPSGCDIAGHAGVFYNMSVCGNGVVEGSEVCDDGNTVDGDWCPGDCVSCPTSTCVYSPSEKKYDVAPPATFANAETACNNLDSLSNMGTMVFATPANFYDIRAAFTTEGWLANIINSDGWGGVAGFSNVMPYWSINEYPNKYDYNGYQRYAFWTNLNARDGISGSIEDMPIGYSTPYAVLCEADVPTCTCSYCGNGVIEMGETCDDGDDSDPSDGCHMCQNISLYWTNLNGDMISEANVGDTVRMVALGDNNPTPTFNIKEGDGWDVLSLNWLLSDDIRLGLSGWTDGPNAFGDWVIEMDDITPPKTSDREDFYFEAVGISDYESSNLRISETPDNDDLKINIISPNCGTYYDMGTLVTITINATDSDDIINGTLNASGRIYEFENGLSEFNITFEEPGSFQIVAEGINDRGQTARSISNIIILEKSGGVYVDGEYVAACIDSPEDFSSFTGNIVDFDASSTRGVRVTSGVIDELIPGEDVFSWYWTFYPEGVSRDIVNSTNEDAFIFTAEFPVAGDNSAYLRVEV